MFNTIVMKVIPHKEQRYDTLGDYWVDKDGTVQFRVSDLGDWRYNYSVLLHEFFEYALLMNDGVTEQEVLTFDLAVPEDSKYADDPGFDPKACYHWQHVISDTIERVFAYCMKFEVSAPWEAADKLEKWKGNK